MSVRQIYLHRKTGNLYAAVRIAVDATNGRDNSLVMIYHPIDDPGTCYVRDEREFCKKFEFLRTETVPA